jgi:hypothetical protein
MRTASERTTPSPSVQPERVPILVHRKQVFNVGLLVALVSCAAFWALVALAVFWSI